MSAPSKKLSLMSNIVFGKELAYNEDIPEIGRERSMFLGITLSLIHI